MKNILILAAFLFLTSLSFIGCQGEDGTNGVAGITGPSGLPGEDGEDGANGVTSVHGALLQDGQHIDENKDGYLIICPAGFHTRLGGQYDGMCVDEEGYLPYGKTPEGCGPHPDNYYANPDGCSLTINDMGCYTPTELENFLNSLAPGFCPS